MRLHVSYGSNEHHLMQVTMLRLFLFLLSFFNFSKADLPCQGVSKSECGYDGVMMELAFECEKDCKELCDKTEDCKFFKWRPSSPLKSCKLYNIEFSEHIKTCNMIAGPRDVNGTCDLLNSDNMSCSVFRNGECTVNMNTYNIRSSYREIIEKIPPPVPNPDKLCTTKCNGDAQCRRWHYTFDKRLCHRWIPRGFNDYGDDLNEVCKAYYAPQQMDKCDCDEKLACFVDPSEAIVIAGGTNSFLDDIYVSNSIELFKPNTKNGTSKSCFLPSLPSGKTEPTIDIVNGEMVVCGGDGGELSCLKLDKETEEWIDMGIEISAPKTGHESWVLENKILFLSGGIYSNETEIFGSSKRGQRSYHGERACAINVKGETIIITGGTDNEDWKAVTRQHKGYIQELPPLNVGRSQHACGYSVLDDESTVLVVAGGYDSNYEVLDSIEILKIDNPKNVEWVTLDVKLSKPLNGLKMGNVNNKLYLVGGKDDQNEANKEIFIFDPSTNELSRNQELPWQSRWSYGMTKVQSSEFEGYCVN